MEKLKAFAVALTLLIFISTGIHFYSIEKLPINNRNVGLWVSYEKDASYSMLHRNITDRTVLYLGSSEFHHHKRSVCHPCNLLNVEEFDLMAVGGAFNQCYSHTLIAGALGQELKSKKIALIVSPTWFYKHRDSANNANIRFSKTHFDAAINNPMLSEETKNLIFEYADKYLGKNQKKSYLAGEKENASTAIAWIYSGKKTVARKAKEKSSEPIDFRKIEEETVQREAGRLSEEYNMYKNTKILRTGLKGKKDCNKDRSLVGSAEYDYLKLFIRVCREQGITPLIIIQPLNGVWYDFTGIKASERKKCYDEIKSIASEYGAEIADLSENEYERGIFEDAVHPSERGWLKINENAYKYFVS